MAMDSCQDRRTSKQVSYLKDNFFAPYYFKLTPIIEYFHIDKLPIHGKLLHKTIETTFIQSGGGTGPMKPGNR